MKLLPVSLAPFPMLRRPVVPGILGLVLGLSSVGWLAAQNNQVDPKPIDPADPGDSGMICHVVDGGVKLEWSFFFFAPIRGYILARDGVEIAKFGSDGNGYFDADVPPGTHYYLLSVVSMTGEINPIARCGVTVPIPGLICRVDSNTVHLQWGPILIDVLILKFRISRNGETIAVVDPNVLHYADTVFALGEYNYEVHAVTSPTSEFLVGRCSVKVTCFGLSNVEVEGLKVKLSWEPVGLNSAGVANARPLYIITRDDELVAKTPETEYTDEVPAPGEYRYQVYADFGLSSTIPVRIIGACLVRVPGPLPAPQDLSCAVVLPIPEPIPLDPTLANDPGAIDSDGDGVVDSLIPLAQVKLSWTNPTTYDKIGITRNNALIATIDGAETSFTDRVRGSGVFVYGVYGIAGNTRSRAAECRVEIPGRIVPPPQDFSCFLLDIVLEPSDPAANIDPQVVLDDGIISPVPIVLLRWWNPVEYSKLVILRNGVEIARLEGSTMAYRDVGPPSGHLVYGIYGILADGRQSITVLCELDVGGGGGPVPPVENLRCLAAIPTTSTSPNIVLLIWDNAARYEAIHISRNGALIARLPGSEESYRDGGLDPGVYRYEVVAVRDGMKSLPVSCQVEIPGPPRQNLLYFSSRPILQPAPEPIPVDDTAAIDQAIPVPVPGRRITCLANNTAPLQGWSFGVASDPRFVVAEVTDLSGTATQAFHGGSGPSFLFLKITPDGGGVQMAVVVSDQEPFETLPVGNGHKLLHIGYGPGPENTPGLVYPVRYSNTIGSPPTQVIFVVNGFEVTPTTLPGAVSIPGPKYLRGDANGDGLLDIADPMKILSWLFLGDEEPGCKEAANVNGSTDVNIADPIYELQFLYVGGPPPPAPFPACAVAPAPLGCRDSGACQ